TALAAEAADEAPRAFIIAAPRFCTVSRKLVFSQVSSEITWGMGLPPIVLFAKSGNIVGEWLPQIASFLTSVTGLPLRSASWVTARFWSSIVIAKTLDAGMSLATDFTTQALVLQGLPTTRV